MTETVVRVESEGGTTRSGWSAGRVGPASPPSSRCPRRGPGWAAGARRRPRPRAAQAPGQARSWDFNGQVAIKKDGKDAPVWAFRRPKGRDSGADGGGAMNRAMNQFFREGSGKAGPAK